MEESERKEEESKNSNRKEPRKAPCSSTTAEPQPESEAAGDDASKVDVCSEDFDPLLALYCPAVPLPFPNIKCFNNVAEYESFQKGGRGRAKPENVEKKRQRAMRGVADPERIERLRKLVVNRPAEEAGEAGSSGGAPRRRREKIHKNVLTRMGLCKGSPLGELHRCVEERIRVKVHIRTFKGLRGVCSGFVVAFDKFWNMAMVDVDETYREPLLGQAFYHQKALTISRLFEKLTLQQSAGGDDPTTKHGVQGQTSETESKLLDAKAGERDPLLKAPRLEKDCRTKVHTRHINQLFIRGENVLLVNPQPL